jgi:hypothetical protein
MKQKMLSWEKLNKLYLHWLEKNNIKRYLINNYFFEDFSIWWVNNLFRKDNILDNKWYLNLKKIIIDKKIVRFNIFIFFINFNLKFILNLFYDLLSNIFIKFFIKKKIIKNKKNCFYSLSYNLVQLNKRLSIDRLYGRTPTIQERKENFYLIKIEKFKDFFFNWRQYLKKFNNLNTEYCILDHYISSLDIIKIYLFCYKIFLIFIFKFQFKKNDFKINQIECFNVLYPHFLDSFSVSSQKSLIASKAINNFFNHNQKFSFFINYLEFNPGTISINYFIRKSDPKIKIITLQHAYASKNMLFYNNYSKNFTKFNELEGKKYCPSPDYYFIFSKNLENLLKKYYKKKILLTGSLRADVNDLSEKKSNIKKIKKKKIVILIAPSIGDEVLICNYLSKIKNPNFYDFIISPHPTNYDDSLIKFQKLNETNFKFSTYRNITTHNLLKVADLVICSLSSIAIDAKILSKDAVRLASHNLPYHFEIDEPIQVIDDYEDFKYYLQNFEIRKKENKKLVSKYINFYYYKTDKKSYKRFWNNLKRIYSDK